MTTSDESGMFAYDKREALALLVAACSQRDRALLLDRKLEAANRLRKAVWEVAKEAEISSEMKDPKPALSMGGLPGGETFYVRADGMTVSASSVDRLGADIGAEIEAPIEYDAGVDAWVSKDRALHPTVPGEPPARRSAVAEVIKLYVLALEAAEGRSKRGARA